MSFGSLWVLLLSESLLGRSAKLCALDTRKIFNYLFFFFTNMVL